MEMSRANQIQIGMLGVIIVLLLVQVSGIFNNGGSSSMRAQERQNLINPSAAPAPAINPATPAATPATTPPTAQSTAPTGPSTVMKFAEDQYDFGTITEGEKATHIFKFTNTGKEPLVISNAKGSCGCTVPTWPKKPIPVGGTGEIEVTFDSKGKVGKQNKQVTITANTNPTTTILRVVGEVLKADGGPAAAAPVQIQPPVNAN